MNQAGELCRFGTKRMRSIRADGRAKTLPRGPSRAFPAIRRAPLWHTPCCVAVVASVLCDGSTREVNVMKSAQLDADPLPSIVLLVDRDQAALASYCARLAVAGLWPAACADPLEAIDTARELRPDLLVTSTFDDLEFDLVEAFKADPRMESLPVILLADRSPQSAGISSRADVFLQKPVSAEQLLASSRSLIARTAGLRAR